MLIAFVKRVLRGDATKDQARDTGMAAVLVLLLLEFFQAADFYVSAAIAALVLTMAVPQIWRPLAVVWLGLSHLLGTVVSRAVLTLIFFAVVSPIGLIRRMMGSDSLKLRAFKDGRASVMSVRNHMFVGRDLERPY